MVHFRIPVYTDSPETIILLLRAHKANTLIDDDDQVPEKFRLDPQILKEEPNYQQHCRKEIYGVSSFYPGSMPGPASRVTHLNGPPTQKIPRLHAVLSSLS
jgi:hypothetical protein